MARSRTRPVLATLVLGAISVFAAMEVRHLTRGANVVLITIDTTRADHLGCYGYGAASTPALDSLAAEGVLFEDAAASSPVTLPSHATILTGLHPPRHGLRDNAPQYALAPVDSRSFSTAAELMANEGYATAAFVSATPLARQWGLDAGFETYDGPGEQRLGSLGLSEQDGGKTVGRAVGWLGRRDKRKPFFLWVHLFDPHHPYAAPDGSGAATDSKKAYDEEIAFADSQVGRLLDTLREQGVLDRTLVIATSDHGEGLGDHGEQTHGYFLNRSTLHVPLLMRFPGRFAPGTRIPHPVSLADILPTMLRAAGHRLPKGPLDGRTLTDMDAYLEEMPEGNGQYAETLYGWRSFRWAQGCTARRGSLKAVDWGRGRRSVYDLAGDPGEKTDVSGTRGAEMDGPVTDAWSLLTAVPLHRPLPEAGSKEAHGTDLSALGYVGGGTQIRVHGSEANGKLPLPDTGFLARFDAALRLVQKARAANNESAGLRLVNEAIAALESMDAEGQRNPSLAFWLGRALSERGRLLGSSGESDWYKAFFKFKEAGNRGFRDSRTWSLMIQCALQAGENGDAVKAATLALEARMDGDSGYWCLIAEAFVAGGERDPTGRLSPRTRALIDLALQRAEERRPSEKEKAWIREIRARIR
ncbi:MAG: sulfatase-like hydrolase/transferase [Planctomycetota bacterium]|jgi:arylsulfatase A-like enzyme